MADNVFQPFQRLDDASGTRPNGLGLGLALTLAVAVAVAKGFTEALGGHLSVEGTPGGGATLVFSLTRAKS